MPTFKTTAESMAQDHTLMASRYELKYLIPHSLALKVREFLRHYVELDEFGVGQPNCAYPVHSLYLDSDDWKLYWHCERGDKNRFKIRVRYYNENPKTPVFFEIKRRMKDVILKQRCAIRRASAPSVLFGHVPGPEEMFAPTDPAELKAIHEFLRLQFSLGLKPKLHVYYAREAYVNATDNEVRITLDRSVQVVTRFDGQLSTHMESPFVCSGDGSRPNDVVILELKFSGRFPNWYQDLVRIFNLTQEGAAKYVEGNIHYAGQRLPAANVIQKLVI